MILYQLRKTTDAIVIHHSLTRDGQTVNWDAIRRYHKSMKWIDVGYHFGVEIINGRYQILVGRPLMAVGAHCYQQGVNTRSIGVCVVGNFDLRRPDEKCFDMLIPFISHLLKAFKLSPNAIYGHRDFANYKSCPGKMFDMVELAELVGLYGA